MSTKWNPERQAEGERLCSAAALDLEIDRMNDQQFVGRAAFNRWACINLPDLLAAYREAQEEIQQAGSVCDDAIAVVREAARLEARRLPRYGTRMRPSDD